MASMALILDPSLYPYLLSHAFAIPLTKEVESVSQHHVICFNQWNEAEVMAASFKQRVFASFCSPCISVVVPGFRLIYRCTRWQPAHRCRSKALTQPRSVDLPVIYRHTLYNSQ